MRSLGLGLGINKLGSLGSKFIAKFGTGLSAAYFLADLGSKRGTVDGVLNPVVQVQRTNLDLRAFTAIEYKIGILNEWVGTGAGDNGIISKWYDGSGNHYDAIQDTVADMPKIVNAGAMVANGVLFADLSTLIATSFAYQNGSVVAVVKSAIAGASSNYIYNGSTNSSPIHILGSRVSGQNMLFQGGTSCCWLFVRHTRYMVWRV